MATSRMTKSDIENKLQCQIESESKAYIEKKSGERIKGKLYDLTNELSESEKEFVRSFKNTILRLKENKTTGFRRSAIFIAEKNIK